MCSVSFIRASYLEVCGRFTSRKSQVCFKDFPNRCRSSKVHLWLHVLDPSGRSFVSQKVLYPSGPTTQARSHQNTRLLSLSGLKCTRDFPFCRTTGLLSAATVWSDKRTAPDVFQPARGHWSLGGGGRGDRTDQNCHPIPSPLVYAGASCIIHLFPHKASNRPGAIKSHGKDVVHFISFFFLISCRIQSPRPQSPPHPPQT